MILEEMLAAYVFIVSRICTTKMLLLSSRLVAIIFTLVSLCVL